MVQPGIGGLDTPRTNVGDATFLSQQQLDFDISQEQSFQSPSKDNNNLIQQLQNGRRGGVSLKTPRSRVALGDRRNLPAGLGGGEFTPLLKSATRNSARRNGKENVSATPAFLKAGGLDNIPEDFSPLPVMGSSVYGQDSRNGSYMAGTPIPQIDSSSTASTPMALLPRRTEGPGVLQDGNQLSLREQENVIDKIEKENFGLKLKIHFLEEALRKAGPGFSEAALKENTELKVDKVTMQKELHQYRKTLRAAEADVDLYRQQLLEMQEKVMRKHANEGQREELDLLRKDLEDKEIELDQLRKQGDRFDDLQDKVHDLEAELREKDRVINDREDEVDDLKDEVEKQANTISGLQEAVKDAQRRNVELDEKAQASEDLADAKETIEDLERALERLKNEAEDAKEDRQEAFRERDRAQGDLEELQDEMANKSITTKGLSRQIEEKANRLQDALDDLREKHSALEEQHGDKIQDIKKLQDQMEDLRQDSDVQKQRLMDRLERVQSESEGVVRERSVLATKVEALRTELEQKGDEKDLLQVRHDALTSESASLQKDLSKSRRNVEELEDKLKHEQAVALASERDIRDEYKKELDRLHAKNDSLKETVEQLNDKIEDLQAESEEKAAGLQRTIDRLQEADGTWSGKEMMLQQALQSEKDRHRNEEAVLTRQIKDLTEDVEIQRKALEEVRSELSDVREELRLSQREQQSLEEKIEGLEDEVEILQTNLDDQTDEANHEISAAQQESESLRRQLQILKQDLAKAESVAAEAQAEVQNFRDDLDAGESSKDGLSSRLRDVEIQLAKVRQDKQALQDQLAGLNVEVHSLRSSNASLEAERDEIQSQLRAMKQQEEETFRLDQERVDLRTAKMKLDGEVRRLREDNNNAVSQRKTLEQELQKEIDRASAEESRLNSEIHDLQKTLRGSSEKRELSTAKKTIQYLEERIHDLESQIASAVGQTDHGDEINERSMLRRDLAAAREKETEYLQREADHRDVLRNLRRQITELERKAHDAEVSRLAVSSPHSSVSGSARKSEIIEVRHQLATAHQTLKDLRSQLKETEKEAARKVKAATIELQGQNEAWEAEKDQLDRALDEALLRKDELTAKNNTSEATITRLRNKIDRLEKALQAERQNSGEDRTMVLERRDLHEMLRETQLQAESLELVVKDREATIEAISAAESELRTHLRRVRDERALQRSKAESAHEQLEVMERKYRKAKEHWEAEKKTLFKGVRFPNMSLSVNDESEIMALKTAAEERESRHVKELRGLGMQIEWLRAKCRREEGFRAAAGYAKRYMGLQIDLFERW